MLYLRTGLPGAGKTLNAIREIDLEHQPDPDDPTKRLHKDPDNPDLPPRTIYYYGIPDMKLDRLKSKWVEFDTPEEWYNLPDGSVIVIDEAQGCSATMAPERARRRSRASKRTGTRAWTFT
ncbi:zonular occludens toxin domain-containing protein [Pseudomonas aeruginosa]|uniref:zonular occludens toxin domain-containing protein n=1 Tax=Pseudomonas aeruginosa TaxID=287 RepID=UPI0024C1FEAB|nr:zonular occludens toxin domain-containing protein [Pseudomonas aeruginosa]WHV23422.1 zonular occludens toxin domain-containing protein [Pseudomonas aeruginosa]